MNSFKDISRSVQKQYDKVLMYSSIKSSEKLDKLDSSIGESAEHDSKFNFQFSHHFIDPEKFEEYSEDSDSSEDEMEIKLEEDGEFNFTKKKKEIDNAIELKIELENHKLEKNNKVITVIWADMRTQNIFLELTPSSIIH